MSKICRYLIFTISVVFIGCSGGGSSENTGGFAPIVQISAGSVQGMVRTYSPPPASSGVPSSASYSVYEYRGIPYALAPTGVRRWALPESVTTLGIGVFKAYDFGPACPQQARFNLTEASANEDCLSINVSTPAGTKATDNLPVFVWIHGGGFIGGSSSLYRLDKLAAEGKMVVVSMNYRLGALGFMPNPAFQVSNSSGTFNGNYGLEDQRLALRWVQENIGVFGGDKANVTVAGESAGAGSICMHLSAPSQVNGLFKQAIIQSWGCMGDFPTLAEAQLPGKASVSVQNGLGCSGNAGVLDCMRSKSVAEILEQQGAYMKTHPEDGNSFSPVTGVLATTPPIINTTAPSSFKAAVTNNQLFVVPLMMGGTKEEIGLYVGYYWQGAQAGLNSAINSLTIKNIWLPTFYPGPSPNPTYYESQISNQYSASLYLGDSSQVMKNFGKTLSDYNPISPVNNCLYLQTSNVILNYINRNPFVTAPIYQFEFDDPAAPVCKVGIAEPCPPYDMGAVHSSELNYLFPNLSNTAAINAPDLAPVSQGLANQIVAYWARFAYTGNPNIASLPAWPLYAGKQTSSVMLLKPGTVLPYNSDSAHQCTIFWATNAMYALKNAPPFN